MYAWRYKNTNATMMQSAPNARGAHDGHSYSLGIQESLFVLSTNNTRKMSKPLRKGTKKREKKPFKKNRLQDLANKEFNREIECLSHETLSNERLLIERERNLVKFFTDHAIGPTHFAERYANFIAQDCYGPCNNDAEIINLLVRTFPKFIAKQIMECYLEFAVAIHDFLKTRVTSEDFRKMLREIIPANKQNVPLTGIDEALYRQASHEYLWYYYCLRQNPELVARDEYLRFLFYVGIYLAQEYKRNFYSSIPYVQDFPLYARLHPIPTLYSDHNNNLTYDGVYDDLIKISQLGYFEWMPLTIVCNTMEAIKLFFIDGKWHSHSYNIAEITALLEIYTFKQGDHRSRSCYFIYNDMEEILSDFLWEHVPVLHEVYSFGCFCLVMTKHTLFKLMFEELCRETQQYFISCKVSDAAPCH